MRKKALLFVVIIFVLLVFIQAQADEPTTITLKFGTTERAVNKQYGKPLATETISVFPLPKKISLYNIDDLNYMILNFSFARIKKIELLDVTRQEEALSIFQERIKQAQ